MSTSVADAVVAPFDQGAQDAADPKTFWMPDEEKSVESMYSEFATTCESSLRACMAGAAACSACVTSTRAGSAATSSS